MGRDPIEEKGGLNPYEFARNNAINQVDKDGRIGWIPIGIGAGVAIGLGYCIDLLACSVRVRVALRSGESEADRVAPDETNHRAPPATQGGDADALTHCIAACNLGHRPYPCFGPDDALDRLQAREVGNDIGTQLDRLNNEAGIIVGIGLQPGQNCTTACLAALREGRLYEIDNGEIIRSNVEE